MKYFLLSVYAAGILSSHVYAANLLLGKANAEAICQTCHGMDGQGTLAGVPNLSGQKMDYLVIQLQAYRKGSRQHAQMSIIAQMLSDEDIENTAKWYSSIRITVESPE